VANVNSYPIFETNQVLNDRHLNELRKYLDEQNRLTRSKLIGIGIVCGFDISVNDKNHIAISSGCGITSEGFLACLEEEKTTFTYYKDYVNPSGYNMFSEIKTQVLLTKSEDNATALSTGTFLNDKVVVALVECVDNKADTCSAQDCDEHGTWRDFHLRFLLITEKEAIGLLKKVNQELSGVNTSTDMANILNKKHLLDVLAIKRVSCLGKNGIGNLDRFEDLALLYIKAISGVVEGMVGSNDKKVKGIFESAYNAFKPVLSRTIKESTLQTSINNLRKVLNDVKNKKQMTQYFYDFVKDMISAYNEFVDKAFDLMDNCCPDDVLFPKHLFLGKAKSYSGCEPSIYRSYFKQPPIYNGNNERLVEVVRLFEKILLMIDALSLDKIEVNKNVRITPSLGPMEALSERAIPYYYNVKDKQGSLFEYWNYDKYRRCKADLNLSYHSHHYSKKDIIENPLCYSLDAYPFFRIEGHQGKKLEIVSDKLTQLINDNNLPIKFIALKLGSISDEKIGGFNCKFEDLDLIYASLRSEIICMLKKEIAFFANLETITPKAVYKVEGATGVSGKVTNESGKALKDINVAIKENPTKWQSETSADGTFQIINMIPKRYTLIITAKGYKSQKAGIGIKKDQILDKNFQLQRPKKNVRIVGNVAYPLISSHISPETFTGLLSSVEHNEHGVENDALSYSTALPGITTMKVAKSSMLAGEFLEESITGVSFENSIGKIYEEYSTSSDATDPSGFAFNYLKEFPQYVELLKPEIFVHRVSYPIQMVQLIEKLSGTITDNLNDFDFEKFNNNYKVLSELATKYKKGIEGDLRNPEYKAHGKENEILEHLNNLIDHCSINKMEPLITAYTKRALEIKKLTLFTNYLEKHPGAEHLAGVEKGGTFILVYDEKNIVVADFALPYICCSDCPPVTIVISTNGDPSQNVEFKLPVNTFCKSDKNEYKFIINPTGGEITGAVVRKDEQTGDYYFSSSHKDVPAEKMQLTYNVNDLTATLDIEVLDPVSAFKVKDIKLVDNGIYSATFDNQSNGANTYQWEFGDGQKSEDEVPEINFENVEPGMEIPVKLAVSMDGLCQHVSTGVVVIPVPVSVEFKLPQTTYFKKDQNKYPFSTSPSGGKVSGNGVEEIDSVFHFVPSNPDVNVGTVSFTYTLGSSEATLQVNVLNPIAAFRVKEIISEGEQFHITFINRSKDTNRYQWIYNEEVFSKKEEPRLVVTDVRPGQKIEVTLTASMDGQFSDTFTETITLPRT